MTAPGKLYLIPIPIAEEQTAAVDAGQKEILMNIHHFLVEEVRTARRYLSSLKIFNSIEVLDFKVLNKDTKEGELESMFTSLRAGKNIGIMSESGCPGIADPGALAVQYAHRNGIKVIPLVGPSSILLSLMASGLNGQQFAFHGYLPIEAKESAHAIKELEKESRTKNQTQIFIETPYRNNQLMVNLLKTLNPETLLCVAVDVTGSQETIEMHPVRQWKSKAVQWPKLPAVFLFLAR